MLAEYINRKRETHYVRAVSTKNGERMLLYHKEHRKSK